jgi:tetrahydromethanopterin S-methyltransferase subunit G
MNKTKFAPPFDDQEYLRIFTEGQKHSAPSPETLRRLDVIEASINGFPAFMQYVKDMLNAIDEKIDGVDKKATYTNGKVAELIKWQNELNGAKKALWGVWGFVGIFITTGVFALFSMWSQVQHINDQLDNIEQK